MLHFSFRCFSRRSLSGMAGSYKEAVHTLNTLQSNAAVLESIRSTRDSQRHLSLPETLKAADRAGVRIQDIDNLSIIHVSGTKGKGSTCAFTESILRAHGYKTGFYSSPHLVEVRERIRVNGKPLSQENFSRYFWQCYKRLESTKDNHAGAMPPYFRFLTIMAFHAFIEEQVDVAILEVGIGGAFDCTNIVRYPVVCGVSSLGMDHMSILGDTIEKIAWHKAGIFKFGIPAFTVPQPEGAMNVLKDRAAEVQCPLHVAYPLDDCSSKIELGIPGDYQVSNASLALQLSNYWLENHTKSVEKRIKDPTVFQITPTMAFGLKSCKWLGRNQKVIGENITYYLDGAHTDASIQKSWVLNTESECTESGNVIQLARWNEVGKRGRVARVLLFNSTGDRKSDVLLAGLLGCKFDCAVFCPNIQRVADTQKEDVRDVKVTLDTQMKRCVENRAAWLSLLKSSQPQVEVSLSVPNSVTVKEAIEDESSSTVNNNNNNKKACLMPTKQFDSIADSLFWISRGQEHRLPSDVSIPLLDLPQGVRTAEHVFVLCTGSLHLVGDILSLLDPNSCLK